MVSCRLCGLDVGLRKYCQGYGATIPEFTIEDGLDLGSVDIARKVRVVYNDPELVI